MWRQLTAREEYIRPSGCTDTLPRCPASDRPSVRFSRPGLQTFIPLPPFRYLEYGNVCFHTHCAWADGLGSRPRFRRALAEMGAEGRAVMAVAERLVGTLRRECLDHLSITNERHLRLVLKEYAARYNQSRPHRSLSLVPPNGPPVRLAAPDGGRVKARPVLGGLHHEYEWEAALANRMYFEPPQASIRYSPPCL